MKKKVILVICLILVLAIASFTHYFGIFTFHAIHYISLWFLLFAISFYVSYWIGKLNENKKKEKGEQK